MRKVFGLLFVFLPGCVTLQQDPQRYWRVECGRVATVQSPAIVNATSGAVQAMPLAAGPMAGLASQGPQMMAGPNGGPCETTGSLPMPRRMTASPDSCSCEAILSRLDRMERVLERLAPPTRMNP